MRRATSENFGSSFDRGVTAADYSDIHASGLSPQHGRTAHSMQSQSGLAQTAREIRARRWHLVCLHVSS
jgi:hypothetical protein